MKKIIILVGVVALVVTLVIFGAKQRSHSGIKVYEEEARKVDRLVTTVKASGEVEPKIFVNISSQVPGQIVDLRAKVGDRVGKGDILLQLDPEQYRSTVTRLEANLRLARINLDKEKTSLT
ncbi:MAG TPA: biotin/lipoyl-binding protein, partial [Patescibacteria group bacterium]|nr:biotin/lipoyl-binding protein [Patescibacteria group bacterium]